MRKHICTFLLGFGALISIQTPLQASLPPPYNSIEVLPSNLFGWYINGTYLEQVFVPNSPKVVVEVGSWIGLTTTHIGSLLPSSGTLYAVDDWNNRPQPSMWFPVIPNLYEQFLSNVIHKNLTEKIIPIRMSKSDASIYLKDIQADFIYIDLTNDYTTTLTDLSTWYPILREGGIISGTNWGYPSICNALETFAFEKGLKVYHTGGTFWYLAP